MLYEKNNKLIYEHLLMFPFNKALNNTGIFIRANFSISIIIRILVLWFHA